MKHYGTLYVGGFGIGRVDGLGLGEDVAGHDTGGYAEG